MLAVCDLVVANTSHETPNSGFLAAILKLYKEEHVFLYAEQKHAELIKRRVCDHGIDVSNLVTTPLLHVGQSATPLGFAVSWCVCLKMLLDLKKRKCRTILVLGCQPAHFYILKCLLSLFFFSKINCVFVLHGQLDELTGTPWKVTPLVVPCDLPPAKTGLFQKLSTLSAREIAVKALGKFRHAYRRFLEWHPVLMRFDTIGCITYKASPRFRYIVLSEHILPKLREYVDPEAYYIKAITMPAIFGLPPAIANNNRATFAIFGYGNSGMLQRVNMALASMDTYNDYEIRIIGMDGRGTEGFPHVTQPFTGVLSREEMESLVPDVDMFLILYEESRYKLCCSAAIIEAHCYARPILYLANDCIDFFNPVDMPIGIRCRDAQEIAEKMKMIINNYEEYRSQLRSFYMNILARRQSINIMNNLDVLKDILTFYR